MILRARGNEAREEPEGKGEKAWRVLDVGLCDWTSASGGGGWAAYDRCARDGRRATDGPASVAAVIVCVLDMASGQLRTTWVKSSNE